MCLDIDYTEMFGHHEWNLYAFGDYFCLLFHIHSWCIEMFGLHEIILYVFVDYTSMVLCIHIECMDMFGLHELILYGLLVNLYGYFWTGNMSRERPLVHAFVLHDLSGSFLTLLCWDNSRTLSSPHLPFQFEFGIGFWKFQCTILYHKQMSTWIKVTIACICTTWYWTKMELFIPIWRKVCFHPLRIKHELLGGWQQLLNTSSSMHSGWVVAPQIKENRPSAKRHESR